MLLRIPLFLMAVSAAFAAVAPQEQARQHLERISSVLARAHAGETALTQPTLVEQAPGQLYKSGLPPVWVAKIEDGRGAHGYLMWENSPAGALLEFALDGEHAPLRPAGGLAQGVPALQQFPVPGSDFQTVASGCVPTAGASLVGYWVANGLRDWSGGLPSGQEPSLKQVAARLRGALKMSEMPDPCGYTNDGMALSGAYPKDLASVLEKDARENGIPLTTEYTPFSFQRLKSEIEAGRPVLLSCMVRLPHKPHLSWGHEIVGVGWLELAGAEYAGVKDNFYPTNSPEAVRWIRTEAFQSLIAALPQKRGGANAGTADDDAGRRGADKKATP